MKSGSSAPMGSGAHSAGASRVTVSHQWSRPGSIFTVVPVFRATITCFTPGHSSSASSALALSGTLRPPRRPSSAVSSATEPQSRSRVARLSGEKPPKTMEWMAPMRAQASMATAASTIIGR